MGYRGFEHRCLQPRYAFGHGLGYTRFELGQPTLSADTFTPGGDLTVSVEVRNAGSRAGSEVVQCYVAPAASRLPRPPKELKAFARVQLEPGQSTVVELHLDDRSFAYWDPGQQDWDAVAARFTQISPQLVSQDRRTAGWQVDPGDYDIFVGRSSADITGQARVAIVS